MTTQRSLGQPTRRAATRLALTTAMTLVLLTGTAGASDCLIRQSDGSTRNEFTLVAPGDHQEWKLGITNVTDAPVTTSINFTANGALANHIFVSVDLCDEPWVETTPGGQSYTCATGRRPVMTTSRISDRSVPTPDLTPGAAWYGRVTATVDGAADLPSSLQGTTATVTSYVLANGQSGTIMCPASIPDGNGGIANSGPGTGGTPSGRLAFTGASTVALLAIGCLGLVGGTILRRRAGHRAATGASTVR